MKNALALLSGFVTNSLATATVLAEGVREGDLPTFEPRRSGDLTDILLTVINWFLFVAGFLAVIYLIYSGILYVTAGGDTEKATKGRTTIINAVIGIVIILAALLIIRAVQRSVEQGQVSP